MNQTESELLLAYELGVCDKRTLVFKISASTLNVCCIMTSRRLNRCIALRFLARGFCVSLELLSYYLYCVLFRCYVTCHYKLNIVN